MTKKRRKLHGYYYHLKLGNPYTGVQISLVAIESGQGGPAQAPKVWTLTAYALII